ncbi:hypothetical protein B0H12DRAFT_1036111, partial [Mycena haematopus]
MRLQRDIFLIQLLRREGRGAAADKPCPNCLDAANPPLFRCQECAGGVLLCRGCCVDKHADNPLHVIQEWNGVYFVKTSLRDQGLRIQFGHSPRHRCSNPQAGHSDFVVLHDNGIHKVHVDFCGCDTGDRVEHHLQLLRAGWYPAT